MSRKAPSPAPSVPKSGPGEIVQLGDGTDKYGIECKISMNTRTKEVTVFAFKDACHRVKTFAANRFGFGLADSVEAMKVAEALAQEIQEELEL